MFLFGGGCFALGCWWILPVDSLKQRHHAGPNCHFFEIINTLFKLSAFSKWGFRWDCLSSSFRVYLGSRFRIRDHLRANFGLTWAVKTLKPKTGAQITLLTVSSWNSWGFLGFPLFSQRSQCFEHSLAQCAESTAIARKREENPEIFTNLTRKMLTRKLTIGA